MSLERALAARRRRRGGAGAALVVRSQCSSVAAPSAAPRRHRRSSSSSSSRAGAAGNARRARLPIANEAQITAWEFRGSSTSTAVVPRGKRVRETFFWAIVQVRIIYYLSKKNVLCCNICIFIAFIIEFNCRNKTELSANKRCARERPRGALPVGTCLSGVVGGVALPPPPAKHSQSRENPPSFPLLFPFFLFTCNYRGGTAEKQFCHLKNR